MTSGVVALGFGKYPQFINPMNFPLMGLEANFGQSIGILAVVWSKDIVRHHAATADEGEDEVDYLVHHHQHEPDHDIALHLHVDSMHSSCQDLE